MPGNERRPERRLEAAESFGGDLSSMPPTRLDRANQELRCAWLRVHADELMAVDPSGLLSAQLRDFADLLEWRFDQ